MVQDSSNLSRAAANQRGNCKLPTLIILLAGIFILSSCETSDYSLIPVSNDGERWGYINSKGVYAINPQFEDADFFSDGLAKIKAGGGKTGYINTKGEIVIPATYKSGTAFNDGLAFVVAEGGLPTCIDKKGIAKFVLNTAKYATAFSEGMAIFVTEEGEWGFVDKTGRIAINAQFEQAMPFSGGFARFWQKGDIGFIDKSGIHKITSQFKEAGNFSEDKAAFSDGRQWGYVNSKGVYVVNPQFDAAGKFSSGLAAIKQGRAFGYIDKTGKLVINPQFDNASPFSNGLAAVQSGNRWGYINKAGKYEINTQFDFAADFKKGIAPVRNAERWGLINKKGQYVVNPQYRNIKLETSIDANIDYVESDYYDTSEFIRRFFEREAGNTFDGVNASTTLEALSDHPNYGAGLNARNEYYTDFSGRIPLTNEIAITLVRFQFSTPIYTWEGTYNNWGQMINRRQVFDFEAKPAAVVYQFNLSGKAWEKRNVVFSALKTEIERRQGQAMTTMSTGRELYCLFQDGGRLSFAIDANNMMLYVAFNQGYLLSQFQQ